MPMSRLLLALAAAQAAHAQSDASVLLQRGPGDRDPWMMEAQCGELVRQQRSDLLPKDEDTVICKGEINGNPELLKRGRADPVRCLNDKAGVVLQKVCQMCTLGPFNKLPPMIYADEGLCSNRYKSVNHITNLLHDTNTSKAAYDGLIASVKMLDHIKKEEPWKNPSPAENELLPLLEVHMQDPHFLTAEERKLADVDGDGRVTSTEVKTLLQVTYIFADMVQEAVLTKEIVGDMGPDDLAAWTQDDLLSWLDWWKES